MALPATHDAYRCATSHPGWYIFYYLVLFIVPANVSLAGQLKTFLVTEEDGEYVTRIVALLDAPPDHVYDVITDYKHIYRINPSIVESELLPGGNGQAVRVRNRFEHCIAVFCLEIEMVEDVVEGADRILVAKTVPELSSFESGSAVWQVYPYESGKSWVQYRASMKPDFFIPPVIGKLVMLSKLRSEISASLTKIECHARIRARNTTRDTAIHVAKHAADEAGCTG